MTVLVVTGTGTGVGKTVVTAAVAALALADHQNREEYLAWAKRIVAWTSARLQAPDGTCWDNCDLSGTIEKTTRTYNTALMLRANLGLYRFTKERTYLEEARRLAQASERTLVNPRTDAFRDDALFSHLLVEAFLDLYETTGEGYLLDRARANADFAWKHLRDSDGGFWTKWTIAPKRREERKTLIANASVARMFWLLADTPEPSRKD